MSRFNYITEPHTFMHILPRICSTIIVRRLLNTRITPNQVTLFRAVFNLLALIFFVVGNPISLVLAFFSFQLNEILDHVDGDLARAKNLRSRRGLFLEYLVDIPGSSIYGLLGLCVSIGIYRSTSDFTIFYVFISILMATALKEAFSRTLATQETKQKFEHARYEKYTDIGQLHSFGEKAHHILIAFSIWHNQIILWAALLFWPVQEYLHFNAMFWGMVVIAALYQYQWLRAVHVGYNNSKERRSVR